MPARCDGRVNGILIRRARARMEPRHCEERKRRSNPDLSLRQARWIASLALAMTGRNLLPVLLFNEGREGVDILLQHLLQRFLGELALVVEGVANAVQVDFRLAEDRAGNTRQDVLQMLGRADAAERSGGVA